MKNILNICALLSVIDTCVPSIINTRKEYITALYFSEWSYPDHLPAEIPLSRITNIYYAFADIDSESYNIKLGSQNALSTEIEFPHTALISDSEDLRFKNLSTNVNSEYFDSLQWIEDYQKNILKLGTAGYEISQGIIGQLRQLKTINPRLNISLSIGGSDSTKKFRDITASTEDLERFVANIALNVEKIGFDGVDIDWEFPSTEHDTKMLLTLIRQLHAKLKKPEEGNRKLITLAVPLDTDVLKNFNFPEMDQYIDYYNLMGYDISGKWSSRSGFQSQLYTDKNIIGYTISVDNTVRYLNELIDKSKIILGMPAYGTTFNTNKLYEKFDGCANISISGVIDEGREDYNEECNIDYYHLPPAGFIEISDTEIGAAYAYSDKSNANQGLIVYDTPKIARLKARYVLDNDLAGGFWWDSKGDPLIRNMSRSLVYNFIDELGGVLQLDSECSKSVPEAMPVEVLFVSEEETAQINSANNISKTYFFIYLFLFHCLLIFI